ncbi:amidase [Saccharopolyspora gregorii]|uniref:Amidase n=1 Tax=Saccharopolyspora gregorii TaxID=33914 RepID=A0ABP6RV43_9PSEU
MAEAVREDLRDGELTWLDATAQAELVARGEVSPLELVEAAVDRIERVDGELNSVITPLFEKALAQAADPALPAGPFRGVPMLLKDVLCHSAGDPLHAGLRVLRDAGWVEQADSHLAARFRAAGFVFCGKANVSELAMSITTEPLAHGPTRNPWDPARSPGGSSGGSAAAVAAGLVPVAHANDMAGSIRIPASSCGLVGLKPTRARTSLGPGHGEHWGPVTHEHVLTRSVRDTAAVLDAIAGMAPGDPYTAPPPARPYRDEVGADPGVLRIGFRTERPGGGPVHPDCAAAVDGAARSLAELGHLVAPTAAAALDDAEPMAAMATVFGATAAWELERWSRRLGRRIDPAELEPMNALFAEQGAAVTAAQWLGAMETAQRWSRSLAALWEDELDVLLLPTLPDPPPPLGLLAPSQDPGVLLAETAARIAFTAPFNLTGQPAISLPLHRADGVPIGVQLVAGYGREDVLVRLAAQLERAVPWSGARPQISA